VTLPTHEEHENAKQTLEYIRRTMESASSYTAVAGSGMVGVGVVGLIASGVAARLGNPVDLRVWVPAAAVAIGIAAAANARKASRIGASRSGPERSGSSPGSWHPFSSPAPPSRWPWADRARRP